MLGNLSLPFPHPVPTYSITLTKNLQIYTSSRKNHRYGNTSPHSSPVHRHLPRHLPLLATSPLLDLLSSPLIAFRPPKPPFRRTNRAFQPFSPAIAAFQRTNAILSSFQSAFVKGESLISLTSTSLGFPVAIIFPCSSMPLILTDPLLFCAMFIFQT